MTHANAPLTPTGRLRLARCVSRDGRCAGRPNASRSALRPPSGGPDRYRAGLPVDDRPSRPQHSPNRLPARVERRVITLRTNRRRGPHRIASHVGLARSTLERTLKRYRMPPLAHLDQATGLALRRPSPVRYEKDRPGQLIHVDIKKLGRIPPGGGWPAHERGSNEDKVAGHARVRNASVSRGGYRYLHHAIDDHSHLAHSQILNDEHQDTTAAFTTRALAHFASLGITVEAVMTDNGTCHRSQAFNQVLAAASTKHRHT